MKTVLTWILAVTVPRVPGRMFLTVQPGQDFAPVAGWQCSYEEVNEPGTGVVVTRSVLCVEKRTGIGAQFGVDACTAQERTRGRMRLIDMTKPQKESSIVALIELACQVENRK